MKKSYTLFLVPLLVFLAGCQDNLPMTETMQPQDPFLNLTFYMSSPEAFEHTTVPPEVLEEHSNFIIDVSQQFDRLIKGAEDWRAADEAVRAELAQPSKTSDYVLADPSKAPDFIREQIAALLMLHILLDGQDYAAKREAIGYYTRLLTRHRNPEAALIVEALGVVKGYWPEDEFRTAASRALEGVEVFLSKRQERRRQALERVGKNAGFDLASQEDAFLNNLQPALAQLRLWSSRG